ncbi:hypothetical protein D3C86_1033370 [compost metagenome]
MDVIGRELRAEVLRFFEAEDDILWRHRLAISPFGVRTQPEGGLRNIVGIAHPLGQQAVGGRQLLFRRLHQCIENQRKARCRLALGEQRIERVEGARRRQAKRAAFWCLGVHIVKMIEAIGMFQFPDRRNPLSPYIGRLCGGRRRYQQGGCRKSDEKAGFQWCQYHWGNVPVFVFVGESIKQRLAKNRCTGSQALYRRLYLPGLRDAGRNMVSTKSRSSLS